MYLRWTKIVKITEHISQTKVCIPWDKLYGHARRVVYHAGGCLIRRVNEFRQGKKLKKKMFYERSVCVCERAYNACKLLPTTTSRRIRRKREINEETNNTHTFRRFGFFLMQILFFYYLMFSKIYWRFFLLSFTRTRIGVTWCILATIPAAVVVRLTWCAPWNHNEVPNGVWACCDKSYLFDKLPCREVSMALIYQSFLTFRAFPIGTFLGLRAGLASGESQRPTLLFSFYSWIFKSTGSWPIDAAFCFSFLFLLTRNSEIHRDNSLSRTRFGLFSLGVSNFDIDINNQRVHWWSLLSPFLGYASPIYPCDKKLDRLIYIEKSETILSGKNSRVILHSSIFYEQGSTLRGKDAQIVWNDRIIQAARARN